MRWLNPVALVGMVTLALPVLIHLFSRQQTRVIPFPSLRFFAPSRILPTRRTRFTDIALLMMRLAILAAAVAALTGPLPNRARQRLSGETATKEAVVVIDDTMAVSQDSMSARVHADRMLQLTTPSRASVVLRTDAPHTALPGAVAWLATQPQPHRLVVMSDFRRAAMDSLDMASIPSNVSVQLERVSPVGAAQSAGPAGTVVWYAGATGRRGAEQQSALETMRNAVFGAVVARGGVRLTVPDADAARRDDMALVGGTSTLVGTRRTIIVASPDADSVLRWQTAAAPLSLAWMGEVLAALNRDTTLAIALRGIRGVSDTAFASPFVVAGRSRDHVPVIAAATVPDSTGVMRLLIVSRAPIASVATAALLLASSNAIDGNSATADDTVQRADDAELRTWERAPSAAPGVTTMSVTVDAFVGPSDGRYLWTLVIVLLLAESFMRRQMKRAAEADGSDRRTVQHS